MLSGFIWKAILPHSGTRWDWSTSPTSYCIEGFSGQTTYHKDGPAANIEAGACP